MNPSPQKDPIPVTVLTGFLGSGKTTLLNRILTERHGRRIAVIENEFGEIGIDNELVIGADEEIFEMNNGCICCTVRGDLIRILSNLIKRKDRLDAVIIETTGLADPAPVAQTFFVDEEIRNAFRLDAIITMVDARHVWEHIETSMECQEQIAFADVILANKTDQADEAALQKLENKIHSMNSAAQIHRTRDSVIALDKILNIRAFDLDQTLASSPDFLKLEMPFEWAGIYHLNAGAHELNFEPGPDPEMNLVALPLEGDDGASYQSSKKMAVTLFSEKGAVRLSGQTVLPCVKLQTLQFDATGSGQFHLEILAPTRIGLFTQHHPDEFKMTLRRSNRLILPVSTETFVASHTHDNTVSSVGIVEKQPLDGIKLNAWLGELLRTKGTDIFRMKGILNIKGSPNRFVFQGVHMLFDGKSDRPWKDSNEAGNQLIFIGRNLNRGELEEGFRTCVA